MSLGGSEYRFVSLKGGALGYDASTERANVRIVGKDSDDARWTLVKNDDGSYSLAPAADRSLRLDVSGASRSAGANLWLYAANGTLAQRFLLNLNPTLTEALRNGRTAEEGVYALRSGVADDKVVDIASASTADGANAQLWSSNKSLAQKFVLGYAGNGLYTIQAAREQEGVRYWSMRSGPRGSEDEGFGCAMLVCYAYNKVLGTDWYGHCWYLWGSANGTGGFDYPLEVVSDPEPGDIIMYLDYDSGWCEAASHAALYIGNGRVIGANGEGSPDERPW